MYYKATSKAALSRDEMERIRKGFSGLLWKVGFGSEFIANNRDELLSKAYLEYVRYTDKGVEIEDPVAWTIHCAWRRTQNFLTLTNARPREVSGEKLAELIDEAAPTSAQVVEDTDRIRKLHSAVGELEVGQRQLLALIYFEGKPLAEAARRLGWHESKARRCRKAALDRVYEILGVESSDEILVEVGLAASLTFAGDGSLHLHAGFEAVVEKAGHEVSGIWARAHDFARRFSLGGGSDTTSAVAASGAGRTAGVCATVAVACIAGASGVVGPGVDGGIGFLGAHDHSHKAQPAADVRLSSDLPAASSTEPEGLTSVPSAIQSSGYASAGSATNTKASGTDGAQPNAPKSERRQVEEQTSGFARVSSESTAPVASSPSASTSDTATTPETVSSSPSVPPPSSSSSGAAQAKQQFGAFK